MSRKEMSLADLRKTLEESAAEALAVDGLVSKESLAVYLGHGSSLEDPANIPPHLLDRAAGSNTSTTETIFRHEQELAARQKACLRGEHEADLRAAFNLVARHADPYTTDNSHVCQVLACLHCRCLYLESK